MYIYIYIERYSYNFADIRHVPDRWLYPLCIWSRVIPKSRLITRHHCRFRLRDRSPDEIYKFSISTNGLDYEQDIALSLKNACILNPSKCLVILNFQLCLWISESESPRWEMIISQCKHIFFEWNGMKWLHIQVPRCQFDNMYTMSFLRRMKFVFFISSFTIPVVFGDRHHFVIGEDVEVHLSERRNMIFKCYRVSTTDISIQKRYRDHKYLIPS